MAKVVAPLQSAEARGRIGGLIYNTWRGMATVKMAKSPAQPRTVRQLLIRGLFTTYAQNWAGLTAPQRLAWNTYAQDHPLTDWTGQPKRITGMDWYIALNVRLLDMGKAAISSPPITLHPSVVVALVLTPAAGQISVAFTAVGGTDTTIDLWLQGPYSKGRIPKIERAAHKSYSAGETSPVVVSALVPGHYTVYARMISETSGLASQFVYATCDVT